MMLLASSAQTIVIQDNRQLSINDFVLPGNYSGITRLNDTLYAVIDDKSEYDGFHLFNIITDSVTGDVDSVSDIGFFGDSTLTNGDCEGIAYCRGRNTVMISRETDNTILEFTLNGKRTGRRLNVPAVFMNSRSNYGFESLTYCEGNGILWTVTESTLSIDGACATPENGVHNRLRLQSFDGSSLQPLHQYAYLMDAPTVSKSARNYALGVSDLAALDDGKLLVLEREFYVPQNYIGSFVKCKIYEITPNKGTNVLLDVPLTDASPYLEKRLVYEFETKLNLTNHSLANYEGMCLGPKLSNGNQVIILISDSQNRYKGVMKDWMKTFVIKA